MRLRKMAKWLTIAALPGLVLAMAAFEQASIRIDGETMSIQELLTQGCDIDW